MSVWGAPEIIWGWWLNSGLVLGWTLDFLNNLPDFEHLYGWIWSFCDSSRSISWVDRMIQYTPGVWYLEFIFNLCIYYHGSLHHFSIVWVNLGVVFCYVENFLWWFYRTQKNSYWLINPQSRVPLTLCITCHSHK